jgi:regulator of sigma D
MSSFLTSNGQKSFSVVPQNSLDLHHIQFDCRSLPAIYDDTFNETVNMKDFEVNFVTYFDKLFNLKKLRLRMQKRDFYPKYIFSDGFSISVGFAKKCITRKTKTKSKPKKISSDNKTNLESFNNGKPLMSGIFEGDNVICSQKYLDQYNVIAYDVNNKNMFKGISDSNKIYGVTKMEYNELSHITLNTKKKNELININGIDEIYEQLSTHSKHTSNIDVYNNYINNVYDNMDTLYNFYESDDVRKLKYDTYINTQKAVSEILRQLIPSIKSTHKVKKKIKGRIVKQKKDPYFNEELEKTLKGKPTLLLVGKGSGNLTISNIRGTTMKGPIKKIINEMSKYCLVILVDEYNTSKLCNTCKNEVTHERVINDINKHKIKREIKAKEKDVNYITKIEKIKTGRKIQKEIKNESCATSRKEKYKELNNVYICFPCHSQSNCNTCKKVWQRDTCASLNIKEVGKLKLLGQNLGRFSRTKDDFLVEPNKKIPKKVTKKVQPIEEPIEKIPKKVTKKVQPIEEQIEKIPKKVTKKVQPIEEPIEKIPKKVTKKVRQIEEQIKKIHFLGI